MSHYDECREENCSVCGQNKTVCSCLDSEKTKLFNSLYRQRVSTSYARIAYNELIEVLKLEEADKLKEIKECARIIEEDLTKKILDYYNQVTYLNELIVDYIKEYGADEDFNRELSK